MKKIIKNIGYFSCYLMRNILSFFYDFSEISILVYHSIGEGRYGKLSVSTEDFERQMAFLKQKGYYLARVSEIVDYIENKIDLPHKTVAITFDDGYEDNYTEAFPVIKEYKIPATIFISPQYKKFDSNFLTKLQIDEMRGSGLVDFEYHSRTHKILSKLSSEELFEEIKNEGHYSYFAYPGGWYSFDLIDILKKNNYISAFSIKPGLISRGDPLFLVKRNVVLGDMPFWQFKLRLTKAIDWYVRVVNFFK